MVARADFSAPYRRGVENGNSGEFSTTSICSNSSPRFIIVAVMSIFCGILFGFAVEKSRVYEPEVIFEQMNLSKFVMMKMFLSGVISGMFCLAVMSMIPFTRNQYLKAKVSFLGGIKGKGFMNAVFGGVILGSGMAIAGTCPGVVFAQVGAGTSNAVYSLLGSLCGALLYGAVEPALTQVTKPAQPIKYQFLYQIYGSPYFIMALPTAAFLSVVVFTLELLFPWESENNVDSTVFESSSYLSVPTWPPYMSGILVGLLQIPVVMVIGDTLGCSSSHCTLASQVLVTEKMKKISTYLTKYQNGLDNWWQVLFILGSPLGSYLSSTMSGRYGTIDGFSFYRAFFGGMMILFGARLAGGCTSGHGLSGIGLMNMLSITAMASLFVGGLVTATVLGYST